MIALRMLLGSDEGSAWKALAHNGLASHAQEWGREWQRAQARAWLHATPSPEQTHGKPFPAASVGDVPFTQVHAIASHAVDVQLQDHQVGSASASAAASRPSHDATASQGNAARDLGAPSKVPEHGIAVHAVSVVRVAAMKAPQPAESGPAPARAVKPDDPLSLRVHVEHGEDGLKVWIGANGDALVARAQAAAVIAELRRADQPTYIRLASVVCNGQTLYTRGVAAACLEDPTP